jgi:hypothetical protein
MVFHCAKVERTVAGFGITEVFALPLAKQAVEGHIAGGEYAQIAVHGENDFIWQQGRCSTYGDCFLADAAKPLGYFALAQEVEHFFFDEPGFYQLLIQVQEGFFFEAFFIVFDQGHALWWCVEFDLGAKFGFSFALFVRNRMNCIF